MNMTGFQCVACGERQGAEYDGYVCPACGHNLQVTYDYDRVREELDLERPFHQRRRDLFRYLPLLPIEDLSLAPSLRFGATPLFTTAELASVGVKLALYPLSAFRAASLAALNVYRHILEDGTQQNVVESMQTRMELYDFLDYHDYEQKLDQLFSEESS